MPLTKTTPRKPGFLCSICLLRLPSQDEWRSHLLACGMADINKRKFECEMCEQAFSKKTVLTRHMNRVHSWKESEETVESVPVEKSPRKSPERAEEDWQEDPGELIFEETDLEVGRTHRKRTAPCLPGVKRRAVVTRDLSEAETDGEQRSNATATQKVSSDIQHCPCCKGNCVTTDVGTQTELKVDTARNKSHQKTIRVLKKYQKDGESVERLEEDIWFD
ncbi:uncharacterized protein LOC133182753 [Saccostrea echinata]|uniref:uncharacterized protein LOC133182753 n=1 Tax=Saccostrea echinata TaxID=191078 RepID=UPI002A7F7F25|nr:uncharacterized protein LOC133182753 [Saccostrea echinata]